MLSSAHFVFIFSRRLPPANTLTAPFFISTSNVEANPISSIGHTTKISIWILFFGRNWLSVGQTKQSRNSFQTSLEKNLLHFDPWLGGKGVESWWRNLAIFNKKKLLLYNSNAPTIHILSSVQDEPRNWMIVQAWRIVGEPSSPYIAYLYYSFLHLIQHTTPLLLSLICSHGICKEILNLYFFTNTRPLTLKSFLLRQKYFHKVLLAFTLYYCSVSVL